MDKRMSMKLQIFDVEGENGERWCRSEEGIWYKMKSNIKLGKVSDEDQKRLEKLWES